MIKILHVVSSLGGGVGSMLCTYYKKMNKEVIKFDFIVHGNKMGEFEQVFLDWGSKVHHVVPKRKSYIKNRVETKRIIKNGNYDIVHCHQNYQSADTVKMAKKLGIKNIIVHSHIAFAPENIYKKIGRVIQSKSLIKNATHLFACSVDAAKWLYGDQLKKQVHIIKNAIETDKFIYNAEIRKSVRKDLGIENKLVIGNIGRFTFQKNHEFLLNVFCEILRVNKSAVLLLVGNGELEEKTKEMAQSMGIAANVKFLGARKDVNKILQAMDIFVFPSRFEGLGIVVLEALAAGLECVVSDKVPKDVMICDKVKMVSLDKGARVWAQTIVKLSRNRRETVVQSLKNSGYCIDCEWQYLEKLYANM